MPHIRDEFHVGRVVREVAGKLELRLEKPALLSPTPHLVKRAFWTLEHHVPQEQVRVVLETNGKTQIIILPQL